MGKRESKPKFIWRYLLENRWSIVTVAISAMILYMIVGNTIHAIKIRRQIALLDADIELYQGRVTRDSTLLERLKYDSELERYAREKYFMQRSNEEIFIIEE